MFGNKCHVGKEGLVSQKSTIFIVSSGMGVGVTVMCLNIGTPKSNKFFVCFRCKNNYF